MILNFTRFHFQLILRNNTTLEKMDAERTKNPVITEASSKVRCWPEAELGECVWVEQGALVFTD